MQSVEIYNSTVIKQINNHTHTHTHVCVYIYIYESSDETENIAIIFSAEINLL